MLYINSKKVDELIDEHKAYLEKKIPEHCKDKEKEIKSFNKFFNKYCGNSDIDNISNKLIDVCLRSDLERVKNEFNTSFHDFLSELKKSKNEQLKKVKEMATLLNKLLSYAEFNEGTKEWNRHIYVTRLGVKICPYCNRNYVTSYEKNDNLYTTADVDHYYPKSLYPVLQMNLYNMIPCCGVCNSRMKSDKDIRHLYPFRDEEQSLLFRTEDKTVEQLYNYSEDNITIDILPHIEQDGRSQGSIDVFRLKQVYSIHKNVVHELIERIYNYQEMKERYYSYVLGEGLYDKIWSEQNLHDIWFDFLHKEAFDEPLVKMKSDIYQQLDIEEAE